MSRRPQKRRKNGPPASEGGATVGGVREDAQVQMILDRIRAIQESVEQLTSRAAQESESSGGSSNMGSSASILQYRVYVSQLRSLQSKLDMIRQRQEALQRLERAALPEFTSESIAGTQSRPRSRLMYQRLDPATSGSADTALPAVPSASAAVLRAAPTKRVSAHSLQGLSMTNTHQLTEAVSSLHELRDKVAKRIAGGDMYLEDPSSSASSSVYGISNPSHRHHHTRRCAFCRGPVATRKSEGTQTCTTCGRTSCVPTSMFEDRYVNTADDGRKRKPVMKQTVRYVKQFSERCADAPPTVIESICNEFGSSMLYGVGKLQKSVISKILRTHPGAAVSSDPSPKTAAETASSGINSAETPARRRGRPKKKRYGLQNERVVRRMFGKSVPEFSGEEMSRVMDHRRYIANQQAVAEATTSSAGGQCAAGTAAAQDRVSKKSIFFRELALQNGLDNALVLSKTRARQVFYQNVRQLHQDATPGTQ